MSGEIVKLRNQFKRARLFADWIQKESSLQEFSDAIRLRPETNYWLQIALVLGIDPPSETTQLLTLCVLEDRTEQTKLVLQSILKQPKPKKGKK